MEAVDELEAESETEGQDQENRGGKIETGQHAQLRMNISFL
jgi:hypothetical protein